MFAYFWTIVQCLPKLLDLVRGFFTFVRQSALIDAGKEEAANAALVEGAKSAKNAQTLRVDFESGKAPASAYADTEDERP